MTLSQPKDILIFRTVSIEKLDVVLEKCRIQWPGERLIVISNKNRRDELIFDVRVSEVITIKTAMYGFPKRINLSRPFQAIVIPIGNRFGSGYSNVYSAAYNCISCEWYIMPYAEKLLRVSVAKIRNHMMFERMLLCLSLPIAYLWSKFFLIYD